MYPVLFRTGGFALRSFDVLVVLGIAAGVLLIWRRALDAGLDARKVLAGCLGAIALGLVGARAAFVVVNLDKFIAEPGKVFSLYGTGFQGALVGGFVALWAAARWLRVSLWRVLDVCAPAVALGQAIGRIGCLLNGCCYGRETDSMLGLYLPSYGGEWARRYPTQLMHSGANLLIVLVLLAVERRRSFSGFLFLLYAILYSAQRLLIDFLRASGPTFGESGVRGTVVASVITIVVAGGVLARRWVGQRDEASHSH